MAEKSKELDGLKKSAILLVLLGPERASKILKKLDEEEVEQLTLEIANLEKIDEKTKKNGYGRIWRIHKGKRLYQHRWC